MREIIMKPYTFDELQGKAKDKARKWVDEGTFYSDWQDDVFSDFTEICRMIGFDVTDLVPHYQKEDIFVPTGELHFEPEMVQRIKSYAPLQTELHQLVEDILCFQMETKVLHNGFYEGTVEFNQNSSSVRITNEYDSEEEAALMFNAEAEGRTGFLDRIIKPLAEFLETQLEEEREWKSSDEYRRDICEANNYEFFKNGEPYDLRDFE